MNSVMVEPDAAPRHGAVPGMGGIEGTEGELPPQWQPAWQQMLEQMADLCVWVDPRSGRILGCNAAFAEVLQYPQAEVQGRVLWSLAEPEDLRTAHRTWHAMARGGELCDSNVTVLTRSGRPVQLSVRSSAIFGPDGELVCGLAVWREIGPRQPSLHSQREHRRRLQTLAYELTVAETRERGRIAQGLHDDIGQLLAMAKLKLGEWNAAVSPNADGSASRLYEDLRDLLTQTARAVRSATFELSCPLLRQFGLQTAIESLGDRIERAGRMAVRVEGELPADLPVSEDVQAVVYRVVRELALNAQRHAEAPELRIVLRCEAGRLAILVRDDGRGFGCQPLPSSFGPDGGFGLVSAEAQMQAIGGCLEIDSAPGRGTCATVLLALSARRTHPGSLVDGFNRGLDDGSHRNLTGAT